MAPLLAGPSAPGFATVQRAGKPISQAGQNEQAQQRARYIRRQLFPGPPSLLLHGSGHHSTVAARLLRSQSHTSSPPTEEMSFLGTLLLPCESVILVAVFEGLQNEPSSRFDALAVASSCCRGSNAAADHRHLAHLRVHQPSRGRGEVLRPRHWPSQGPRSRESRTASAIM